MLNSIHTFSDVENFFSHLILNESLNFHPDEDFRNYINLETDLPSYTPDESDYRNKLMEACFDICDKDNLDIYGMGIEMLYNRLKR